MVLFQYALLNKRSLTSNDVIAGNGRVLMGGLHLFKKYLLKLRNNFITVATYKTTFETK